MTGIHHLAEEKEERFPYCPRNFSVNALNVDCDCRKETGGGLMKKRKDRCCFLFDTGASLNNEWEKELRRGKRGDTSSQKNVTHGATPFTLKGGSVKERITSAGGKGLKRVAVQKGGGREPVHR